MRRRLAGQRILVVLGLTLAVVSSTIHLTTAQDSQLTDLTDLTGLTVSADKLIGQINPYVYGVNHGPWSLVPPDMLPQAEALGLTYLRFPAGEYGDSRDLTPFDIDMFMTFAHQMHAEPSISARLKGGTPQAAAKLVQYVNIEKKYGVRYWSVGNEADLYKNYSLDQHNRDWRAIAQAMLSVDPTIILIGPDVSQYPPPQMTDPASAKYHDWLRGFLKVNGDLIGIVSVHRYPFPKSMNANPTTLAELKDSAQEWDSIIPDIRKAIKETTNRDLPVAITEVNSHWNKVSEGAATPDSYYNAVWWADVLGRLIRQRVDIVAYFTLYTAKDLGTFGLLKRDDVRPTYYVYQLYRQFGTQQVYAASTDDDVTVTGALRSDGTLTLMVVNPTLQAKSIALRLSGFSPTEQAELWRLDPDHKAERIGGTPEVASGMLHLPAQSVSLYISAPNPVQK